ncbi:MAG: Holliday junction branch migration DNA helicase RuvB, partial [Lentilactobacillus parabuchneri]|nr:Holliday junction branch migration DNA helicase RuvB [Lentilactobacillus parabuchneri]
MANEKDDRLISPENVDSDESSIEKSLRPQLLSEYIGQDDVKNELKVYIQAA